MMNQDNIIHLRAIFDECDVNQSGFINKDQLRELVAKITTTRGLDEDELDTLMKTLDTDNDGQIGFQEFINGYTIIDPELLVDANEDGYLSNNIDMKEIDNLLNQEYSIPTSPVDYIRYLRSIFDQYDEDRDGMVNIAQLRAMLEDIKTKSGIEGDDDDVDYIIQVLNDDGKDTISFEKFMSAIEHINSPSQESPQVSSFEPIQQQINHDNNNNHNDNHNDHQQLNNDHQLHDSLDPLALEEGDDFSSFSTNNNSSFRSGDSLKRVKGRASSWVAPVSIVNMIKKRAELFAKDEHTQVFTDASIDASVHDAYKRKEALLRSENEHLGSKINMVEDQLREVRESHEKLSEDNAQLKQSVVIGKKTLVHNQKLVSQNKQLEEMVEQLKEEVRTSSETRNDLQRTNNKLKQLHDALSSQLETAKEELSNERDKLRALEEQSARNAPLLKKAHSFQHLPVEEVEKIKQENLELKQQNDSDRVKAQENIKLLTEEYQLLKKQSKEDKSLLESSNQIIHKLKLTLEEQQSRTHNSDPNYKLSLLSELEHQVVTRLGTPGTLDYSGGGQSFEGALSPLKQQLLQQQDEKEKEKEGVTTQAISIANGKGREKKIESDTEEDISLGDDEDHKGWQDKFEEVEKQLQEAQRNNKKLQEEIEDREKQIKEIKEKLVNETKVLNQTVAELTSANSDMTQVMSATSTTLELTTGQVTELREQVEQASSKVERLQDENRLLKSQMEASLPAQIDPVNIKAEQTQNELSLLKQRVEELANTNNSLANENVQLKQSSFSPITSPSSSKRDIHDGVEEEVTPQEEETVGSGALVELQGQVSALTDIKKQLETDLKRYQAMSEQSSAAAAQLSNTTLVDQLQKDNNALKTSSQKLDEKYRVIEYQYQQLTDTNKDLQEQHQTLQDRIEIIKLEYETKISQSNSHFEKKNKIIKENEELKQRLRRYESDDHQIDIIEMEDETKSLRTKLEDLNNRLQNERNLNKDLRAQLDNRSINSDREPLINNNNNAAHHNRRQCCGLC